MTDRERKKKKKAGEKLMPSVHKPDGQSNSTQ